MAINKAQNETALVSGRFQVIHSGHIRLFKLAHELSQKLTVALDVHGLSPHETRGRLQVLTSIEFVSKVLTFDGDLEKLLMLERPDIVIKGSEFQGEFNLEESILGQWGGRLVFSSGDSFFSESDMINSRVKLNTTQSFELPNEFMERNDITRIHLLDILERFKSKKVCVLGDLIVDEIINCHPLGMSQEEPTVVVTPIDRERYLGGAGIVAAHCAALGATTTLITVCGDDEPGQWSLQKGLEYGFEFHSVIDVTRPTTLKQRYRSGTQTLLKMTHLRQELISPILENEILERIRSSITDIDILIFSDFSYGMLTEKIISTCLDICRELKIYVAADSQSSSQRGDLSKFKLVNLVTATEKEARLELRDENSGLVVLADKLRSNLQIPSLLLKLGGDGLIIHSADKNNVLLPTDQVPALNDRSVDTSGAGDSLLASASLCLGSGSTIYEAALFGSAVAAIQVGRIGNVPVGRSEILGILSV